MATRIIIDSTADFGSEYRNRALIVPLTVHFGNEEYIDGVTITHEDFYKRLTSSETLPTTSAASPGAFDEVFKEVTEAGDEAVVITVASKLSGTYQSACIMANEYDNIYVVDSTNVTLGSGALVQYAFRLLDEGMGAKEIAEKLNEAKERLVLVAYVDTLEYLSKGGRLSKGAALIGGVLNIKPIVSVVDGVIESIGKARGTKASINQMLVEIEKLGGIDHDMPIVAGYSGLSDEALVKFVDSNRELLQSRNEEVQTSSIGSVVGTHAGPGALGVGFFVNKK
ncbi:MAG: DegV family protein [Erysipelotrichaceae bacterium]|nr:DegV family protein [Erysipelotrichaceae bacterium]